MPREPRQLTAKILAVLPLLGLFLFAVPEVTRAAAFDFAPTEYSVVYGNSYVQDTTLGGVLFSGNIDPLPSSASFYLKNISSVEKTAEFNFDNGFAAERIQYNCVLPPNFEGLLSCPVGVTSTSFTSLSQTTRIRAYTIDRVNVLFGKNNSAFSNLDVSSYFESSGNTNLTADKIPAFLIATGPACGNGEVEEGEQCDDGNTAPGDGCSATCSYDVAEEPPNLQGCSDANGYCYGNTWQLQAFTNQQCSELDDLIDITLMDWRFEMQWYDEANAVWVNSYISENNPTYKYSFDPLCSYSSSVQVANLFGTYGDQYRWRAWWTYGTEYVSGWPEWETFTWQQGESDPTVPDMYLDPEAVIDDGGNWITRSLRWALIPTSEQLQDLTQAAYMDLSETFPFGLVNYIGRLMPHHAISFGGAVGGGGGGSWGGANVWGTACTITENVYLDAASEAVNGMETAEYSWDDFKELAGDLLWYVFALGVLFRVFRTLAPASNE